MDWTAVILTLLGAFVGTALSIYVPALLERLQYKRRKEFFGIWQSAYQSLDHRTEWVDEEVVIDLDGNLGDRSCNGNLGDKILVTGLAITHCYSARAAPKHPINDKIGRRISPQTGKI